MSNKQLPERITLREERRWRILQTQSPRDPYAEGEWKPYQETPDAEIDKIIAEAHGDPQKVMRSWFISAKPFLVKRSGVHLIPGQIQRATRLPVRQVYVHYDEVYAIDLDGCISVRLV